jgi:hypothetical protein
MALEDRTRHQFAEDPTARYGITGDHRREGGSKIFVD